MKLPSVGRRDIALALSLYLLNVFDMACTMIAVGSGYAMELNPAMRFLMQHGMGYFVFVKVVVMGAFTFGLLYVPLSRRVNTILVFLAGMYAMLGLGHVLIYLNFR